MDEPLDDDTLAVLGHLNRIEFSREMTRWSGQAAQVVERDGILLCASSTDFPVLFNIAHRVDPSVPAEHVVATADRFFAALGRGYTLEVRSDQPSDVALREVAERAGLVALGSSPEMVVAEPVDEPAVPADIELRWLAPGDAVDDFVGVADAAYTSLGMTPGSMAEAFTDPRALTSPEIQTVLAYLDGAPVAAAQVLLSHGIAGVYCVATVEVARGRGLGDLVTRAVTNRGFECGARASTLQASVMGEPIYGRMGYRELYRYSSLVRFEAPTA